MTVLYAATSALVRAYLPAEDDHAALSALLRDGDEPVITSELARLQWTSALHAAVRAGRLAHAGSLLAGLDADAGEGGRIALLRLDLAATAESVCSLLARHELHTLDATHLAVALGERERMEDELVLVSRDHRQRRAAEAEGLTLR